MMSCENQVAVHDAMKIHVHQVQIQKYLNQISISYLNVLNFQIDYIFKEYIQNFLLLLLFHIIFYSNVLNSFTVA